MPLSIESMKNQELTRRSLLSGGAALGAAAALSTTGRAWASEKRATAGKNEPFLIGLNSSTLRGHKLPLAKVIDIAAKAGYGAIELWVDEIDRHVKAGGNLKELKTRLDNHGLAVTGAIAFFEWMVDDDAKRAKGFEEAKRRMDQLAQIGGTHIAAPPVGDVKNVDLLRAAERYRALLEVSESFGVTPAVEIWGRAGNLYRLGQAVLVAMEANHPAACILPDVFHLYRGGSGLAGVRRLNANLLAGFHLNDYPADPPREKARDSDRVYPGDGVAPLAKLVRDLRAIDYDGVLSVELFNPNYYKRDPMHVAKTALEKTREVIRAALG